MRPAGLMLLMVFWASSIFAQHPSNYRFHKIGTQADTIRIDTLSIIPSTFIITTLKADTLKRNLYSINFAEAILIPSDELRLITDSLVLSYRVFPIRFTKPNRYLKSGTGIIDPLIKSYSDEYTITNPFNPAGSSLYTSGNLSRGIQIGNNQDASLNSNLNLQLSGKISPTFNIEAQLSDASIPVQPEGNTQQIQDFDRLHIRIYNPKTQLLAGDFSLDDDTGYFVRMNKNLQGVQLKTSLAKKTGKEGIFTTRSTGAVVKGKFNRMRIQGQEGNQGPYRLLGSQGEQYIQIIAGSEKVFIDGLQIERGDNEDYTINYNTAEISFTTRNLITKDKRITVQFEYTERSYARFVAASDNQWKTEKGIVYLNIYNEFDAKNQPLLQDLSNEQKTLLSQIGDDLEQAQVNNYYETSFQNDRVLYKLTDTLASGIRYSQILVFSTNPDSARYQAGFSRVGDHEGNYVPVQSSANGQVYKWVEPLNGIPQGNFEPVTKLVTPKKKQVYSLGTVSRLGEKMTIQGELTISSNDLNSFSNLDSGDNTGTGIRAKINRLDHFGKDSSFMLNSFIEYRRVGNQFNPLEPFRSIEFERDWNLEKTLPSATENLLRTGIQLSGQDSILAGYTLDLLNYSNQYSGSKHNIQGQYIVKNFKIDWNGSLLKSEDSFRKTSFLRHEVGLTKSWSNFSLHLKEKQEGNQWSESDQDTFLDGSFKFQEWQAELSNTPENKIPWFVKFQIRNDYLPDSIGYKINHKALVASTGLDFKGKAGNSSSLSANWRKLDGEENTATIRAEEQFQLSRGALISRTFYEIGSGLERKQDFYYLEVPPGQGYYTWADYNGNNIKELDEFEPSVFADQANFIRVFRPGNDYVPVYTNRFTQSLSLNPGRLVKSTDSKIKFLNLFNNQFSFNANRRNSRSNFASTINPFAIEDSLIVSLQSQFRNRFSFNTSNTKFGMDYIIEKTANQNLMTYGTDFRKNMAHHVITRWHLIEAIWLNNQAEKGKQEFLSSFFSTRNYQLDYMRNTLSATLESSTQTRIKIEWNWSNEENIAGDEKLIQQKVELGGDYQSPGKGLIHIDLQYLNLNFIGLPDSPIGYVMLKGYRPGHNGAVNISFRRKLSEVIQLDLSYGARLSQNSGVIHTGNIAVRAVF